MVVGSLYVATSGGVWRYLEKGAVFPTSSHWWFTAGIIIMVIMVAATALTAYITTSKKKKIQRLREHLSKSQNINNSFPFYQRL
jgi:hypothetical protein